MNAFVIKLIAVVTMVIDHIGLFFFPGVIELRMIGRVSFPLFAWLIANGAEHSRDRGAYLKRLSVLAVVTQVPYYYANHLIGIDPTLLNVVFTLALGLAAIMGTKWYADMASRVVIIGGAALVAQLINADYGAIGVLSIVTFSLLKDHPKRLIAAQVAIFFAPAVATVASVLWSGIAGGFYAPIGWLAVLALPIILMYNGTRGPKVQYFFYIFYPAQYALLWLFKTIL